MKNVIAISITISLRFETLVSLYLLRWRCFVSCAGGQLGVFSAVVDHKRQIRRRHNFSVVRVASFKNIVQDGFYSINFCHLFRSRAIIAPARDTPANDAPGSNAPAIDTFTKFTFHNDATTLSQERHVSIQYWVGD